MKIWILPLLLLLLSGCTTGDVAMVLLTSDWSSAQRKAAYQPKPDSAVIINDLPKRFNQSGEKSVYFKSVDGLNKNETGFDFRLCQRLFVSPGTHRLVVDEEGAFWWLESRRSPEIEAVFIAQHVYRITAKKTDHEVRFQLWDENDGVPELITEVRLPETKA